MIWTLPLTLSLCLLTSAFHVTVKQSKRTAFDIRRDVHFAVTNAGSEIGLNTVDDLIYTANVTLGGVEYPVQLDTGSSDLWIQSATNPNTPLPYTNQTSMTYNLTYGIGWVYGHISYAAVDFAGIIVPSQAFLDVTTSQNPALSYGAEGLLGLGFTSLSSIDNAVNATGSSKGRSLLYNLFEDNPSEPNFIAFSLQRASDSSDTVLGNFSIGEYDPAYTAVGNSTAIPTWPVTSPTRWNILLEAIILPDHAIMPTTQVSNAPSNRAVALLDSGTSYTYAPPDVCNKIYGNIPGATYDSTLNQWDLPCDAEIDVALQFGGQVFPLHPLDVNFANPSDASSCVGTFLPQTVSVSGGQFDWLIGDNFLRSVYSVYDFGDFDSSGQMGNPYIKLLSLINPDQASAEFHAARGGVPNTNITYNVANSNSSPSDSTSVNLSSELAQTLNQIGKYFPAMLGVMALNALILIVLVIVGIVFLCRGRTKKSRMPRGRKSPMPMRRASDIESLRPPQPHSYQPVSMALTEDTMFTPPSPGFRKFGNDSVRKSAMYRESMVAPEDTPFVPPSPVHAGDRPSSSIYRRSVVVPEDPVFTPPSPIKSEGSHSSFIQPQQTGADLLPPSAPFHAIDGTSQHPSSRPLSVASRKSSIHQADDGVIITNPFPVVDANSRPSSIHSQHVGVALSDDYVNVPPSRAFLAFQNGNLRPGDRPQSFTHPPGTMPPSQDHMLSPPSPGFYSYDRPGERPRSIA